MTTPIFGFEFIAENDTEAAKTDAHNRNWIRAEAILKRQILDRNLSSPPASPSNGDVYLVPQSGSPTVSGGWEGQEDKLAVYYGGWLFIDPIAGPDWYVVDEGVFVYYSDAGSPPEWIIKV